MIEEAVRRSISPGEGLGLFTDREPQSHGADIPEGAIIVSADNHIPFASDVYYERFPDHLKEKAPRLWWDETAGIFQIGVNFQGMIPESAYKIIRSIEDRPGCRDLNARMGDLDAEGIAKEVVFPQNTPLFFNYPDMEVREWIFKIYNEYMAEMQAREPKRFFPVGIPNYWDPAKAAESIREIKRLGLKTYMLPFTAKEKIDGGPVCYTNPEYEPMWAAAEEVGLPVCFHIGESFKVEGRNQQGASILSQQGSSQFRKVLGELIFGLIFDNYPNLKIIFAEAGINWVAGALQDAEMLYNAHGQVFDELPKHRPSYYWHKHCYATFQYDVPGLRLLDIIGADRVMWAVDYPHNEGTFGYTQDAIQNVIDAVSADDARKILGETALDVYNIRD